MSSRKHPRSPDDTATSAAAEAAAALNEIRDGIRDAADEVRRQEHLRRVALVRRDELFASAYFDAGLRVFEIAYVAHLSPGVVQIALRAARAARAAAAAAAAADADSDEPG